MSTTAEGAPAATYDVVLAGYKTIEAAKKDFDALVKAVEDEKVTVAEGVILVTHDGSGEVRVTDAADHRGRKGLEWGGGIGILVGLFSPPLLASAVIGAAAGGLVGKFVKHRKDSGIGDKLGQAMPKGSAGIIAMVDVSDRAAVEQLLSGALMTSVAPVEGTGLKALKDGLVEAGKISEAAKVYLYGYPLVYGLHELAAFVAGAGGKFPMHAPYNQFGHGRELAGPEFKFVTPNNDTPYSIAVCDLSQGPLVLHVPDTHDRYYVLQMVDAWTNNFAYVGRRATGTGEAEFLLAPAGYAGEVPDGMGVIHAPTTVFLIVGRIQADGAADLPAVHALQDQFTLTPLSVYRGGVAPAPVVGIPKPDPRVGDDLAWWEQCRVLLAAYPPPTADAPFLKACEQFGLLEAKTPYVDLEPERAVVLVEGKKAGDAMIEELMKQVHASPTGWQSAMHLFDYNLDFYEIGTIDAPEWKMDGRTQAYVMRAVVARGGMYGNHGYEADYGLIWVDADGNALDGSKRYELHLEVAPPVDAFWSLTMYDVPNFYLVANPIDRYSIGDRTPGLKYGEDGSVTLYLQKDSPGTDKESNWLPTPEGAFRPVMRMYQPRKEILAGTYQLPAIRRAT